MRSPAPPPALTASKGYIFVIQSVGGKGGFYNDWRKLESDIINAVAGAGVIGAPTVAIFFAPQADFADCYVLLPYTTSGGNAMESWFSDEGTLTADGCRFAGSINSLFQFGNPHFALPNALQPQPMSVEMRQSEAATIWKEIWQRKESARTQTRGNGKGKGGGGKQGGGGKRNTGGGNGGYGYEGQNQPYLQAQYEPPHPYVSMGHSAPSSPPIFTRK